MAASSAAMTWRGFCRGFKAGWWGCEIWAAFWALCETELSLGMVPDAGFEPATFGLQNRCTTTVLIRQTALRLTYNNRSSSPSRAASPPPLAGRPLPGAPCRAPLDCEQNPGLYAPSTGFSRPDGAIAQLVERLHGMQKVSGSIPLSSTNPFNDLRIVLVRNAGFPDRRSSSRCSWCG